MLAEAARSATRGGGKQQFAVPRFPQQQVSSSAVSNPDGFQNWLVALLKAVRKSWKKVNH